MAIVSFGKGVRGCTPFEFQTYYGGVVYLKCQTCEYEWVKRLDYYKKYPPKKCPVCDEFSYIAFWMVHDSQMYEYKYFKNISKKQLVITIPQPNTRGLIWGKPGLYLITVWPAGVTIPTNETPEEPELPTDPEDPIDPIDPDDVNTICSSLTTSTVSCYSFTENAMEFFELTLHGPVLISVYSDDRINKNYPPNIAHNVSNRNLALDYDGTWYDCSSLNEPNPDEPPSINDCIIAKSNIKLQYTLLASIFDESVITKINSTMIALIDKPIKIYIGLDQRTNKNLPIGLSGNLSNHIVIKSYTGDWHDCGININRDPGEFTDCELVAANQVTSTMNVPVLTTAICNSIIVMGGAIKNYPIKIMVKEDARIDKTIPPELNGNMSNHILSKSHSGKVSDCGYDPDYASTLPPPEPEYMILALLKNPTTITEEEMFHRDMLIVPLTNPSLFCKKAYIHREVKQNTIIDIS